MKLFKYSFTSVMSPLKFKAALGVAGALAVAALVGSSLVTRAHATGPRHDDDGWLEDVENLVQVAELDQLLADFHGALSYGGNLAAMSNLWVENSSLIYNGVEYDGKAAVLAFFTSGGYFHNNWVSLAPEYKTQITVHGDKAEASTQCVGVDIASNVVKVVVQVNATAVKRGDKWFFSSMNNTSPAPL